MITLGSMFAGIGGLELGFESTGRFETKWQVEIDDYAIKVLSKHWPSVARWKNVKTFPPRPVSDWQCDVIAGGFPCQDLSFAGKGAGLAGERSGLFSEIIRVASIIKPRAIVLENVAALYARGLDVVLGELAQIGYDAEWHCVSAASVGAPHRRDRVFIIGWNTNGEHDDTVEQVSRGTVADTSRSGATLCDTNGKSKPVSPFNAKTSELQSNVANSVRSGTGDENESTGRQKRKSANAFKPATLRQGDWKALSEGTDASSADCGTLAESDSQRGRSRNTQRQDAENAGQSPRCQKHWGWHSEPSVGRVANGVPKRVDRLRCLGNAIVPQVAQVVAERLLEIFDEQNPEPNL